MNLTATNQRGFAPTNLTEAISFSEMLSKSQMVPKAYQNKPEDVLVAVQWGFELGLAPLQALQNIACINGKPSVYGDAAMALAQNSPVCEGIEEYFEGEGTPNPVAVCVAHRKNRTPVTAKFSVEDAKRAGLWGKQGPWQAYPKRMLQMRARGFALRDAFPDVLKGLITVEEASDYPEENGHQARLLPNTPVKNPLDTIGKDKRHAEILPAPVPEPAETSDPAVIHAIMERDQEADKVNAMAAMVAQADAELVEHELSDTEPVVLEAEVEHEPTPETEGEWVLEIPGKEPSYLPSQELWSKAYEALADKVFKYEKMLPRTRMTKLRELKEANEPTANKLTAVQRISHTATYSKRLAALGAQMGEGGAK